MGRLRSNKPSMLVAVLVAGLGIANGAIPTASAEDVLRVRKSVTDLTLEERADFVDGVLALKSTPSPYDPSLSYYDQFVAWHVALSDCNPADPLALHRQMSHAGPMFLPWHRQYLLLFEDALRAVTGKDIAVPYWDWTDPASVASVFAEDFMGGDGDPSEGYAVMTGPFRKGNWKLVVGNYGLEWGTSATTYLARHFGSFPGSKLPTQADVAEAFAAPSYDVAPFDESSDPAKSFRNALEGWEEPVGFSASLCAPDGVISGVPLRDLKLHNIVHVWVGGTIGLSPEGIKIFGTMTVPLASPNDPAFFLHHANIDRLWAEWQESHGIHSYQPGSGYEHNNVNDVMKPFDEAGLIATPADVADITQLGYRYATQGTLQRPAVVQRNAAPASAPLFCRMRTIAGADAALR